MSIEQWQTKMTFEQWHSLESFSMGGQPASHYHPTTHETVKSLMLKTGIDEQYFGVFLFLFEIHRMSISEVKDFFTAEHFYRELEPIKKLVQKLPDELKTIRENLLKQFPIVDIPEEQYPNFLNSGRPKEVDTVVIKKFSNLARYVWAQKLISGKGKKHSKEAVYPFIFDFISACGHSFSKPYSETLALIKDYLKSDLQAID